LPSLNNGWLPQDPMDMNGYWLVCLKPHAPPAKIREGFVSRIAQIDEQGTRKCKRGEAARGK
jgi:hypothetical protein